MSFRSLPVVIIWLGLLAPAYAREPTSTAPAAAQAAPTQSAPTIVDPYATELLKLSQRALRAVRALAYDADWVSEGVAASVLPSRSGHVILARNNSRFLKMRADSWVAAPDGRLVLMAEMISNGDKVASISHERKQYRELTGPGAGGEILRWHGLIIEQLLRGELYKNEIAGGTATYKGTETVDGVECHVVEAANPDAPVVARWFIGKRDLLPRRVMRTLGGEIGEGHAQLTLSSLDPNPAIDEKAFELVKPEGYNDRGVAIGTSAVQSPLAAQFLPIGSEAPDWSLRNADGKQISLADLRGKVVLLSFWASWAAPCVNALPSIQQFCESYKDRPVAAYIVNAFEHHKDAAKVAQTAGLLQALLPGGDEVAEAYEVQGIPTFYLISPEGKVLFAEGGVLHVDSVKAMVDRALGTSTPSSEAPKAP
jgi:peroxiredoxin